MTAESKTEKLKMNIHQRINAIMGDLDYVQKEDKKVNNQYTFASHDAVTAALHPLFVRHRITCNASVLSHTQDGNLTCVDLLVTYTNIDKPDDTLIVNYFGYGIDPQDKGPGKALSYAKKYANLQTFNLATGDDPERASIDHIPAPPPASAVAPPLPSAGAPIPVNAVEKILKYVSERGLSMVQLLDACANLNDGSSDLERFPREKLKSLKDALEKLEPEAD